MTERPRSDIRVQQFHFRITKEVSNFLKYGNGDVSEAAESLIRVLTDLSIAHDSVFDLIKKYKKEIT
jgi:hypothetical protein